MTGYAVFDRVGDRVAVFDRVGVFDMTGYAVFGSCYNFLRDLLTEKHCRRKTCRNVFTALTTAVFLSANMFSFPTLDDLKIVDGNLLACQAEFNLRGIPSHIQLNKILNLVWLLAFLHQYRLQTLNRLKAAAFGISSSYNYNYIFYLPVQC